MTDRRPPLTPLARWLRSAPRWQYVTVVLAAVVLVLLVAMVLNPGDLIGPVQPAMPPVDGARGG